MSALTSQIGGSHYKDCKIQPAQYIEANNLKFLEGCVVKRVTLHDKPTGKGRQDIEKAIHELQLLLELRYGPNSGLVDLGDIGKVEWSVGQEKQLRLEKGYTLCPKCKEVTPGKVGLENTCVQCGHKFELGMNTAYQQWGIGEERMDVIGQNGNDGEHYRVPDRPVWWVGYKHGQSVLPGPTVSVYFKWDDGHEALQPVMVGEAAWSPHVVAYRLA